MLFGPADLLDSVFKLINFKLLILNFYMFTMCDEKWDLAKGW